MEGILNEKMQQLALNALWYYNKYIAVGFVETFYFGRVSQFLCIIPIL